MAFLARLFGGGGSQQSQPAATPAQTGPTEAERAMQRDRAQEANRANAEADQRISLASRVSGLRRSLSFRDRDRKKSTLGA